MQEMEGKTVNQQDVRDQPSYQLSEAARYLRLPPATLRSWTLGRPYPTQGGAGRSRAIVRPPKTRPTLLSFWNQIEAHVLRALRTDHGVTLSAARKGSTSLRSSSVSTACSSAPN